MIIILRLSSFRIIFKTKISPFVDTGTNYTLQYESHISKRSLSSIFTLGGTPGLIIARTPYTILYTTLKLVRYK